MKYVKATERIKWGEIEQLMTQSTTTSVKTRVFMAANKTGTLRFIDNFSADRSIDVNVKIHSVCSDSDYRNSSKILNQHLITLPAKAVMVCAHILSTASWKDRKLLHGRDEEEQR